MREETLSSHLPNDARLPLTLIGRCAGDWGGCRGLVGDLISGPLRREG